MELPLRDTPEGHLLFGSFVTFCLSSFKYTILSIFRVPKEVLPRSWFLRVEGW